MSPAAAAATAGPFCACCGGPAADALWCSDCELHVAADIGQPYWERSFYARYERPCPIEIRDRTSA